MQGEIMNRMRLGFKKNSWRMFQLFLIFLICIYAIHSVVSPERVLPEKEISEYVSDGPLTSAIVCVEKYIEDSVGKGYKLQFFNLTYDRSLNCCTDGFFIYRKGKCGVSVVLDYDAGKLYGRTSQHMQRGRVLELSDLDFSLETLLYNPKISVEWDVLVLEVIASYIDEESFFRVQYIDRDRSHSQYADFNPLCPPEWLTNMIMSN